MNMPRGSRLYLNILSLLAIIPLATTGCQSAILPTTTPTTALPEATVILRSTFTPGMTATSQPVLTRTPGSTIPATAPALQQVITIETPAPGTIVGSPVVITGRTSLFPPAASLGYRVRDSAGNQIGVGGLPVQGDSGGQ